MTFLPFYTSYSSHYLAIFHEHKEPLTNKFNSMHHLLLQVHPMHYGFILKHNVPTHVSYNGKYKIPNHSPKHLVNYLYSFFTWTQHREYTHSLHVGKEVSSHTSSNNGFMGHLCNIIGFIKQHPHGLTHGITCTTWAYCSSNFG